MRGGPKIYWSLLAAFLPFVAAIVWMELRAKRRDEYTISRWTLQRYHQNPWPVVPVLCLFVFGCCLIAGHVVQLFGAYLERTGVTQDVATFTVLLASAIAGLTWGSRIWPM